MKTLTIQQLKRKLSKGNHQMLLTMESGKDVIVRVWKSLCYPDYSCSYSTDAYTHYNCSEIPIERIAEMKYLREEKPTTKTAKE